MGAYAAIERVNRVIERNRTRGLNTRKPKIDHQVMFELQEREARILRRQAAEEAELVPDRPARPLMFDPALSSGSAQSA